MKKTKIKHLKIVNLRKSFPNGRIPAPGKIALYASCAIGIILFLSVLIFILFPQTYIDGFLKKQVIDTFAKAYPQYSLKIADVNFSILKNRVECNSISFTRIDSTFTGRINSFSLGGIDWVKLLREKIFSAACINKATLDAEGIVLNFKQLQYQIQCRQLRLSIADSAIIAYSLEYHPLITDEQFFAESKFRNTRYRLIIPKISVNGLAFSRLLYGDIYHARSINVRDVCIDVLVNMDKPWDTKSPNPMMPYEAISSIKDTIGVDSLQIINSRLNYFERYKVGAKPASVTFDNMQAFVEGVVNYSGRRDTIVIHAQAAIMNTGVIKLLMLIPLGSPHLCFSYSGSLQTMEAGSLNKFLEIAENQRINSGMVESASYNVRVNSGHATGYVHAEYNGLSISFLNKNTGSEKGIFDRISSFISKTFIIKANNEPDKSGSMRIGVVKYTRKPDETFIQFVWLAIRSGITNIIGL
jgi:hypothetical protein